MKRTHIDRALLEKVLPPVPDSYMEKATNLIHTLPAREEEKTMRRKLSTTLALVLVMLAMLAGIAFAAIHWGSREMITYTDADGVTHVNESLLPIIQTVGETFENDVLKIDVIDAIYDGRSVILSWLATNKSAQDIYLLQWSTFNGEGGGAGSGWNDSYLILPAGETIECGFTTDLSQNERVDEALCETMMRFTPFLIDKPLLQRRYTDPETNMGMWMDDEEVTAQIAAGNIVFDYDHPVLGTYVPDDPDMRYEDMIVDAGAMEMLDELEAHFTLAINVEILKGRVEGQQVLDGGDHTLRLLEAAVTPNTVVIRVERTFPDRETAMRYATPYQGASGSEGWALYFLDAQGNDFIVGNCGYWPLTNEPQEQPDGTWTWAYEGSAVDIIPPPDTCYIVSGVFGLADVEDFVPVPEESLVVRFE